MHSPSSLSSLYSCDDGDSSLLMVKTLTGMTTDQCRKRVNAEKNLGGWGGGTDDDDRSIWEHASNAGLNIQHVPEGESRAERRGHARSSAPHAQSGQYAGYWKTGASASTRMVSVLSTLIRREQSSAMGSKCDSAPGEGSGSGSGSGLGSGLMLRVKG